MHNTPQIGRRSIPDNARSVLEAPDAVAKAVRDWITSETRLAVDTRPRYRTPTLTATPADKVIPVSDNMFAGSNSTRRKAILLRRTAPTPPTVDAAVNGGTGGASNG